MSTLSTFFQSLMTGATTALSSLTPSQLRQVSSGFSAASSAVAQAVESEEMDLLGEIQDNPANASAPLATLTGISGVPRSAVSLVSDGLKAYASGPAGAAIFQTNMSNAKAIILQQKIGNSGLAGLFGG